MPVDQRQSLLQHVAGQEKLCQCREERLALCLILAIVFGVDMADPIACIERRLPCIGFVVRNRHAYRLPRDRTADVRGLSSDIYHKCLGIGKCVRDVVYAGVYPVHPERTVILGIIDRQHHGAVFKCMPVVQPADAPDRFLRLRKAQPGFGAKIPVERPERLLGLRLIAVLLPV